MSDSSSYPLSYTQSEIARLASQAEQLSESTLPVLVKSAQRVLEIGCGAGANLPLVQRANPSIHYTGIDISGFALAAAAEKAKTLNLNATFINQDATALPFSAASFDLVFIKLVLWSVGTQWQKIIQETLRVLKPGGILYCFEPDDGFLCFHPKKPALETAVKRWQEIQVQQGCNPFIGRELYGACVRAGFKDLTTRVYSKVSQQSEPEAYRAHMQNLITIFLGKGPNSLGFDENSPVWKQAQKESQSSQPDNLILETHMVLTAQKGGE